jgi:hypothetical protein
MILIVGPGLLLGSPLGRSAFGTWGVCIIMALAVAGVAVRRRLRSVGLALFGHGLTVQDRTGQRTLPWTDLTAVTARSRTTARGAVQTIELRFRRETPIYVDDEFTVGRDQLVQMIREHAAAARAVPTFAEADPAAEARFRRTGLIAVGVYCLSILIVFSMAIAFALHAGHVP